MQLQRLDLPLPSRHPPLGLQSLRHPPGPLRQLTMKDLQRAPLSVPPNDDAICSCRHCCVCSESTRRRAEAWVGAVTQVMQAMTKTMRARACGRPILWHAVTPDLGCANLGPSMVAVGTMHTRMQPSYWTLSCVSNDGRPPRAMQIFSAAAMQSLVLCGDTAHTWCWRRLDVAATGRLLQPHPVWTA